MASGKTILAEILVKKLEFNSVSTRLLVAKLIGMNDFGTSNRTDFQTKAAQFIKSGNGAARLAKEIKTVIGKTSRWTVIDGVRQVATLKNLRSFFTNLTVLYIDSSRDDAFRNFQKRTGRNATLDEFRKFRFHEVEKEIPLLKYESDAYIFNGGNQRQLLDNFKEWFYSTAR